MPKGEHLREGMAAALHRAGYTWKSFNHDYHWQVKELGLDIWPTRQKTMRKGKVKTWWSVVDFEDWLKTLQPSRSGVTRPNHDEPLYAGDIPPWEEACLLWQLGEQKWR